MKRFVLPPLLFTIILLITAAAILLWWNDATKPPQEDATPQAFVITRGMTASQIATKLKEKDFIKSSLAFRVYVQTTGRADKIQAGDYRLTKNLPLSALVGELTEGPIALWITLPEGLRREEIALRFADGLELSNSARSNFIDEFIRLTNTQEGFLFPDTYLFLRTATSSAVINKLTDTFEAKVDNSILERAQSQGLTRNKLVTLASLVERETRTSDERPVVAGILLKRLEAGWPLQVDATLQYILGNFKCQISNVKCNWWEPVQSGDKQIKSPYNTYTNRGLPPGPIANPGLSSIKAVANPQNSSYWFYLHDREGVIHYAETAEDHAENIRNYLQ
ncbi:endolytic transglycosylase MltG [Candidatus Microgenomates bacterium]|nr:endolytic transglycosylase MltG [Candidatus Microgenomates bacterium]